MREKNAKISDVRINRWDKSFINSPIRKSKYLLQNMIYVQTI